MIESPYPLEQDLGMRYYATATPGIGGRIKVVPEDFIVEEIPPPIGPPGRYLLCRLTKRNWELIRAVKEIARCLGISHRRISWGGNKDRRALTRQVISLYDVTPEQVEALSIRDITIEVLGHTHEPVALGSHEGNRFIITVREADPADLEGRVAAISAAVRNGVPNYVGVQRFGVVRPITHRVGEAILKGDYAAAFDWYVGVAFPDEQEEVIRARREYAETHDVHSALHQFPVHLTYERALLHHLAAHPGDHLGALQSLPPRLLSIFVAAFQSYIFNMTLSARIEAGDGLLEPSPGDNVLLAGGRTDRVRAGTCGIAREQVRRGRCSIIIPIPGSTPMNADGPDEERALGLLDEWGISGADFRRASEVTRVAFNGAHRVAAIAPEIIHAVEETSVRLTFSLQPGNYATTICREFMKADPRRMI
ncbi:MAG: tRNA pseudouridine(13) synthase TruD [Methanomicrobiales archaeon]|nr:tRNA pseudouridine(13) synthase TruD [Methanomicrobiales archaeon]